MSYNSRLFHSVYRRARRRDEPYCPLELIPQRKSLYPPVQFFLYDGTLCEPGEHYYVSVPPGFPPPLGYVLVGTWPFEIGEEDNPKRKVLLGGNDGGDDKR